jgi:ferredoxin
MVSRWRIAITPDYCTQCRLCEEACPFGAIRHPSAPFGAPAALTVDRRRLARFLLLLPVLVAAGVGLGLKLGVPASRLHPTVDLAEKYLGPRETNAPRGPATPESLALGRAEQDPKALLTEAVSIRQRFRVAGGFLGGWIGLAIGLKLVGLSLRHTRPDYEPDRGACVACGRCYLSCPNERVRLGLLAPSEIPAPPAAPAAAAKAS